MTQRRDVDRLLSTWSEDAYSPPAPAYLTKVLERTRRTRQRRAWASLERWLPMCRHDRSAGRARALRLAWILLIVVGPRRRRGGNRRRRRAALRADPGAPAGGDGRARVRIARGRRERGYGRRLHRQGRWHRPSPAQRPDGRRRDQRCGHRKCDVLVARWPRIAFRNWYKRQRLDRGHGRRRRQSHRSSRRACRPTRTAPSDGRLAWSPDGRPSCTPPATLCDGPHTCLSSPSDGSAPPLDGFVAPA